MIRPPLMQDDARSPFLALSQEKSPFLEVTSFLSVFLLYYSKYGVHADILLIISFLKTNIVHVVSEILKGMR